MKFRISDRCACRLRACGGGLLAAKLGLLLVGWPWVIQRPIAAMLIMIPVSAGGTLLLLLGVAGGMASATEEMLGELRAELLRAIEAASSKSYANGYVDGLHAQVSQAPQPLRSVPNQN
ncbi:hypothetical protein Rhe02_55880 [Rhizocola hellebori]|uniref:Uncharacterized protein n=1 Tax=Rhizocola hellebori TaxID=1392758 RepID=A0A8J3QDV4_9ACTN|nr:hypothetical protein [Rhizocola hellebori]GIH07521.1 hypothetical protein Rhe02_55880 [Rhizocola hellebori]